MLARLFASKQRPYFKNPSHWDTLSLDLSGSRLEITLPPQDYDFPEKPHMPKVNVFDESLYRYKTEPDRNGNPPSHRGVTVPGILKRNWFTYGPIWRASHIGSLQCYAVIADISRMTPKMNCFNPDQLERLIMHDLYYSEGPGFGRNEHTCPVNWQVRSIQGTDWVYLESWSKKPSWKEDSNADRYKDAHFSVWLFTPLFENKYLLVTFTALGSMPAEASNRVMFRRIEAIIDSLKLQLSPEALRQKAEAEQAHPEARYSPRREPESWQYYGNFRYGNILEGEPSLVFEGPCSPPPPLY